MLRQTRPPQRTDQLRQRPSMFESESPLQSPTASNDDNDEYAEALRREQARVMQTAANELRFAALRVDLVDVDDHVRVEAIAPHIRSLRQAQTLGELVDAASDTQQRLQESGCFKRVAVELAHAPSGEQLQLHCNCRVVVFCN